MAGKATFTNRIGRGNMSEKCYFAETRPINFDDQLDENIRECLRTGVGKSFIVFASAGSGKTYSLKEALDYLKEIYAGSFLNQGKQIAVVTYTNNAANEITDRIEQNSIFAVSTIHSFCWSAIAGFNEDIRKWYLGTIPVELEKVKGEEERGRAGKASDARKRTIARLEEKIEWLNEPRSFIYDPNGVNSSLNALSHADVLKIFSSFLTTKPMMKEVIVNKFPFIFIDESQDTNKDVINAFFSLQDEKKDNIVIGLFGDTMQRIFWGGEVELGKSKPHQESIDWKIFNKAMNHRSARRIVGLGNQIRREGVGREGVGSEGDGREQYARDGAVKGCIRYFLLPNKGLIKNDIEDKIRSYMAKITDDNGWIDTDSEETAILLLEHKMAGRRLGFEELWEKLSRSPKIKDRIAEGDNTELNFFSSIVFPLADASRNNRRTELMAILRENRSPLLESYVLNDNKNDPLSIARAAECAFRTTVLNDNVSFQAVLDILFKHKLLRIPEKLQSFVSDEDVDKLETAKSVESLSSKENDNSEISAWAEALETNFFQIRNYKNYVDENSIFNTHQGVKGNEFERVMVIMDDSEAGGFLFSYEQYFGAKEISKASQKKLDDGEEIGLVRTRRLFYVTSTRAKSSLAHVIYTSDVVKVRENLIARKFAQESEIVDIDSIRLL